MTKHIFLYFFSSIALIFEFYFGILSGVGFVIQIILIAMTITVFIQLFPRGRIIGFSHTFRQSFFGILGTFGFFFSIFLLFTGYYTFFPGILSDITLTNGKQRITFLQMSHIATERFYEQKKETIQKLNKTSPLFLIEGVGSGTEQSHERFDRALGMEFDSELYPTLAAIAGLEVQSGGLLFSGVSLTNIENVDMTMDEIASFISTGSISFSGNSEMVDIVSELAIIGELSSSEQSFFRYVFRSFLNWSITNMPNIDELNLGDKAELFDIILTKRNQKIIDYIVRNPDRDIVVVYGALHFPGVFEAIKIHDKKWKIESYASYAPYSD